MPICIRIPGLLAAPGGLSAVPMADNDVLISWNPPFTLSGVLIKSFLINVVNSSTGEIIESATVAGSVFNFTHVTNVSSQPSLSPCIPVEVSILGVNKVGEGNTTNTHFYYNSGYCSI